MTVYTLKDLARAAGMSTFAVRHNIRKRFIPPADGSGSKRHFTDEHLHLLLACQRLRAEGVRDANLHARLEEADEEELRVLAGVALPAPPVVERAPPPAVVVPAAPVRSEDDLRRALAAVVSAAADAMDLAPKRVRPALVAALRRMKEEGIDVDEAIRGLGEDGA